MRYVDWIEYMKLSETVVKKIPHGIYDYVLAVPEGGNVLAVDVAKYLECPIAYMHPDLIGIPTDKTPLVVDEIVDTGKTLKSIQKIIGFVDIACLQTRHIHLTKYWAEELPIRSDWIHYPWEF